MPGSGRWVALFPALFVLLWSTGFVVAKLALPYAGPLSFLLVRFLLVALLLAVAAVVAGARWPDSPRQIAHLSLAGLLVQATYLGGVFWAISRGMHAGTAAMLVGLQPIVTVFLARGWLGEQVSSRQWAGLALGLVGVYFVVEHKIALGGTGPSGYVAIFLALAGISAGTIYQKRYCSSVDLRTGSVVQFVASAIAYVLVLPSLETYRLEWNAPVIFALAWSVLVLSVVAISVLYWLLRHGAAASVAGLFYLVPPATALEAYWLFGERLTGLAFAGMGLIAVGVALSRPTISPRLVARAVDRD